MVSRPAYQKVRSGAAGNTTGDWYWLLWNWTPSGSRSSGRFETVPDGETATRPMAAWSAWWYQTSWFGAAVITPARLVGRSNSENRLVGTVRSSRASSRSRRAGRLRVGRRGVVRVRAALSGRSQDATDIGQSPS